MNLPTRVKLLIAPLFTPTRLFILSFAGVILVGAILLWLPLSAGYMIFEMAPPDSFFGKTIAELQLRNKYHIEVIAIRDVLMDQVHMIPHAGFIIKDGEVMVIVGGKGDINKIK
jgi:trk system potassium uptake protein TrkA